MVPDLLTQRLLLRRPEIGDSEAIADLHSDPAVMRFIDDGKPVPRMLFAAATSAGSWPTTKRVSGYWIGVELAGASSVGWFGLRPLTHSPSRSNWAIG